MTSPLRAIPRFIMRTPLVTQIAIGLGLCILLALLAPAAAEQPLPVADPKLA